MFCVVEHTVKEEGREDLGSDFRTLYVEISWRDGPEEGTDG